MILIHMAKLCLPSFGRKTLHFILTNRYGWINGAGSKDCNKRSLVHLTAWSIALGVQSFTCGGHDLSLYERLISYLSKKMVNDRNDVDYSVVT